MAPSEIAHSRPWITDADIAAVRQVAASGMLAQGDGVAAFERLIADHQRAAGAVATSTGTAALALALLACDVGDGDEVVVPSYTCRSVADAVRAVGATPIYCDVGESWIMTPARVEPAITSRTRAIILVHIFGIFAETSEFRQFGLPVIEDACQAFAAGGQHPASSLCVYSFHATKCLTTGEGGAVASSDPATVDRLRALRANNILPGRMTDVQAALGISQLDRYDRFVEMRKSQAKQYFSELPESLTARLAELEERTMYFRFPLRVVSTTHSFDDAFRFFAREGIAVRRGVDALLHRDAGLADERFPGAVACFDQTVSIPLRPGLSDDEREHIIDRVQRYVGS